ncbi:hypothetical protein EJD97_003416 [Solanum chilense]|uniref:Uncharacterized protein n=1 Tax=Solanum chilense TaxID=4083 RepID=A0A6N2BZC9_SOLCI|nr:hypothetical protein EJD97_003416 [Solanum chilense]
MLEICQNAAGSTDLATGRRGHGGPSWTPSSHTLQILMLLSSLPLTAGMTDIHRHNGPRGSSFHNTNSLEFRYLDSFSDHYDEPAGWTVMSTTVRHVLRNPTLCQTSTSSFSSFTTMSPTDRHRHYGPSQAP